MKSALKMHTNSSTAYLDVILLWPRRVLFRRVHFYSTALGSADTAATQLRQRGTNNSNSSSDSNSNSSNNNNNSNNDNDSNNKPAAAQWNISVGKGKHEHASCLLDTNRQSKLHSRRSHSIHRRHCTTGSAESTTIVVLLACLLTCICTKQTAQ